MPLKIVRNDITHMNTEAIVNTASEKVEVGPGCDTAIYNKAGFEDLFHYRKERIGKVAVGKAFITPGFNLDAKYIIHVVSPLYIDGESGEEYLLRECYRNALALVKENNIESIAFPLISTGSFGYPREEGLRIALDEINLFLLSNEIQIYLVVFDNESTELGKKINPELESYINSHYVQQHLKTASRSVDARSVEDKGKSRFSLFRKSSKSALHADKSDEIENDIKADTCFAAKPQAEMVNDACFAAEPQAEIEFSEEHESALQERMNHLSDTFQQYLFYLIESKGMTNAEVHKRAIVDKKVFSKIKNNVDYHPKKITALCLCIGARLNMDETRDLLARAGYALSPCDKTDVIFSYFIENKVYDMIEIDIQLEEHGLPCIIQ